MSNIIANAVKSILGGSPDTAVKATKPVQAPIAPYEPEPYFYEERCQSHYELLTVERAKYYKGRIASNQRKLNTRHARRIGERNLRGEHAPEIAVIDIQDDVVCNGQHTVQSVIETGRPAIVRVRVWPSDVNIMPFFDRAAKPRSTRDVYRIEGREIELVEIAVINRIFWLLTNSTRQVSKEEQAPILEQFHTDYLSVRKRISDRKFLNGTFGAGATVMLHQNPLKVLEFVSKVTRNEDCTKGTLLYCVSKVMTAVGPNGKQISVTGGPSYDTLLQIIWAIDQYIHDGNIRCRQLKQDRNLASQILAPFDIQLPTFEGLVSATEEVI